MQAVNDLRAIVHGAEQAEARGDHAGAERLLRQALALQEANLGAQHPEVANTLNNLAIVCEMNGKLADAEACYRRAYAIATSSLPPTDPLVTTSRDNLEQFCTARGVPFKQTPEPKAVTPPPPQPPPPSVKEAPPAPPRAASPLPAPPRAASPPSQPRAGSSAPPPPVSPRASSAVPLAARTLTVQTAVREPSRVPAIALGLAALIVLVVGWFAFNRIPAPARTATAPAASAPAPTPPPAPAASKPESAATSPAAAPPREAEPIAPPEPAAPASTPAAAAPEPTAATTGGSALNVVIAQVCRGLTTSGAWRCTPGGAEQGPGTMYFYTRVASPRDTVIEHRWYRDGRLHQRVPLRIRANPSGFRTYSRTMITADRAGTWKVELRAPGGELLHEETFAIR